MEFSFIFTLWWLELHTITAMVDCQSIFEGWLEDATLFPVEHNDYSNFDGLPKTQNDDLLSDQWHGLQWLEENMKLNFNNEGFTNLPNETDLPIKDDPNSFTILPNDADALIYECFKSYPDIFQCDPEDLILPSDDNKTEINNNIPYTKSSIPSSPVSKSSPLSPPYYESISEASSPASYISDIPVDSTLYGLCLSPTSTSDSSCADNPPVVSVTICENVEVGSEPPVPMTIEEVASSVKERKYLNAGREKVPKVQVSLKNTFHPYSKTKSGSRKKRTSDPAERKKVQDKEAAARYCMRKRSEEQKIVDQCNMLEKEQEELQSKHERKKVQDKKASARYRMKKNMIMQKMVDQCNMLEKEQEELQSKHDDILSEIKYLKSLMREMLQKKGLM